MDFKALITKLDVLEKKQVLTEAEDRMPAKKKETSWTDKSGKKHPATQVQGHQSRKADKEAEKESKKKDEGITFQSNIANELLKEFGLDEAPADPARAQYDKFKADDAKAAAVKQIQAMLKPNGQGVERLQNAIDPKTGIIYYGEEGGEGGTVNPRQTPYSWIQKGQQKEFQDLVKAAGLTIVPVDQKTLFGTTQVAAVDPKGLATLGQTPAAAPAAAAPTAAATPAVQKMDPNQADLDDAEMGKAMAANAAAAAGPDKIKQPTPGSSANPPGSKLDPAKLKRFQELLDKVKAGDKLDGGKAGGSATPASSGGSATPAAAGAAGGALLKVGSQGPEVEKVQAALKIAKDGKFGPETKAAVEKFQKDNGLQVDGVVGPQTRAKLFPAAGSSANPPATTPLPGKAVPGGGNIADNPAAESLLRDDQILAVIKALKL